MKSVSQAHIHLQILLFDSKLLKSKSPESVIRAGSFVISSVVIESISLLPQPAKHVVDRLSREQLRALY